MTETGRIESRGGRQRRRDLGAAGRRDGRRVRPVDARRPPARALKAVAGTSSRGHAVLPRSRQPRLRQRRARRGPVRRLRGGSARALDRRCALGSRVALAPAGSGAVRTVDAGRHQAVPVPGEAEVLKLVCHPDAMTPDANPLLGPFPGVPGFCSRGGPVAERLRGRGRDRQGDRRVGHRRRDRARRQPYRAWRFGRRTATRCSRPSRRARPTATTTCSAIRSTGRVGPPQADRAAALAAAGARLRLRREERLGAGRLPRAGEAVAAGRRRSAGLRMDRATVVRRLGQEHAAFRERAGLIDLSSFGKIEVRGTARSACSNACATTGSTGRSAPSSTRSS